MADGRFAPSPTGDLHLGNLRTALAAWLFARSTGSRFVVRMEDLDRVQSSATHEASQLADLAALGIDWDGEVVRQSERFGRYEAAIAELVRAGLTYPCYCTRREIREAAMAPHEGTSAYPGTCRDLRATDRARREQEGRPPALRLRSDGRTVIIDDALIGPVSAVVDDVVLRRNDGVPAYNLAVVVDDAAQRIGQVVRAEDLAGSAPTQRHLAGLLGLPPVQYAHVPLVVGPDGRRLAKRDGAVTLAEQRAAGRAPADVRRRLLISLGVGDAEAGGPNSAVVAGFDPRAMPRGPIPVAGLLVP